MIYMSLYATCIHIAYSIFLYKLLSYFLLFFNYSYFTFCSIPSRKFLSILSKSLCEIIK